MRSNASKMESAQLAYPCAAGSFESRSGDNDARERQASSNRSIRCTVDSAESETAIPVRGNGMVGDGVGDCVAKISLVRIGNSGQASSSSKKCVLQIFFPALVRCGFKVRFETERASFFVSTFLASTENNGALRTCDPGARSKLLYFCEVSY